MQLSDRDKTFLLAVADNDGGRLADIAAAAALSETIANVCAVKLGPPDPLDPTDQLIVYTYGGTMGDSPVSLTDFGKAEVEDIRAALKAKADVDYLKGRQ
jgi:hypothetical protein